MVVKTVQSCCCYDLRTGGFILGYINLATIFIVFLNFIIIVSCLEITYIPLLCIGSTLILLFLFNGIAFVYGLHTNKHKFMLPTVILTLIGTVVSIIQFIGLTFTMFMNLSYIFLVIWFIGLIILALNWYFTSVIWSLYNVIEKENHGSLSSVEEGNNDQQYLMEMSEKI